VQDVAANPSLIVDAIPFIAATDSTLNSTNLPSLSWSMTDIFEWATFEGMPLDVSLVWRGALHAHRCRPTSQDIVLLYDYTLGNCFTFNGRQCDAIYLQK
jgi:hypothetical protein